MIVAQQIQTGLEFPEGFRFHHGFSSLAILTASYREFPVRTPPQTHPHSRRSAYCGRQKLNGLNVNKQPGEKEKTEQRCVKVSHASREITRPVL
jgi:hypothetical protein